MQHADTTPRRAHDWSEMLHLAIDRTAPEPLFRQIAAALRGLIARNTLPPGARLPSTRRLSLILALSRASVVAAYDQLLTEGLIEAREGSGTFVATNIPRSPRIRPAFPAPTIPAPDIPLSAYASRMTGTPWQGTSFEDLPFNAGRCGMDSRTLDAWRRLTLQSLRSFDRVHLGYSDPRGTPELRRAVTEYLRIARAVQCDPDQIMIVGGAHHAIDMITRILIDPGDPVWIEDPGYPGARAIFTAAGARLHPIPVDAHGLRVQDGIAAAPNARLAYVTPSNQYPLGHALAPERRAALLDWAQHSGAWIIEDDYDSEFRYSGHPLPSLQGTDRNRRVIYVGTFSKVLLPGIRIGYMVVPPDLMETVTRARYLSDRNPPTAEQLVLSAFINEGFFASHIARMRVLYRQARDALVAAIAERMQGLASADCPDHGLQVLLRLANGRSDTALAATASEHRIIARPTSPMYLAAPPQSALLLGFSGHRPDRLRRAVHSLAALMEGGLESGPVHNTQVDCPPGAAVPL